MAAGEERHGSLRGLKVVEMAGIGPVPLAALILAEMGATVLRVERLSTGRAFLNIPPEFDLDRHGRPTLAADLKHPDGVELVRAVAAAADVIVEGYRPGVMERLGLGPEALLARNPRLVYARMTGFGQDGPLAARAGHDLTYLALTGLLHAIGPAGGKPVPPLNLVADYGGGTMFLVAGVLAALVERSLSGLGQVVDAAMVDGASVLATPTFAYLAAGIWRDRRGANLLDSGCPFYDTYACADGRHVAVACLEPQFFAEFARLLPLGEALAGAQYDTSRWPEMRAAITARIGERTRDEWAVHFADGDACVAPVLSLSEAPLHPHNRARRLHREAGPLTRPGPAPRFSRTPSAMASGPWVEAATTTLAAFGVECARIEALASAGVIGR